MSPFTLPSPTEFIASRFAERFVVDGLLYVLGGYNNNQGFLNSMEVKERGGPRWTSLPLSTMPSPLMWSCAASIGTTGIMVAGGQPEAFVYAIDQAWSLDLTTGIWTPEQSMPHGVRAAHACIEYNYQGDQGMLLTGGCDVAGCSEETTTTEFFNYRTRTWTELAPLNKARSHHTMAYVGDKVAAIAGDNSLSGEFDDVELFDGVSWTTHPSRLTYPRDSQGTPAYVPDSFYKCY